MEKEDETIPGVAAKTFMLGFQLGSTIAIDSDSDDDNDDSDVKNVGICLLGLGKVGRAFVRLVFSSKKRHLQIEKVRLRFLAVSDSSRMIVAQRSKEGIPDSVISKLVHHKEIGNRLSTFTCDSKTTAAIQSNELSRILEIAHELANYDHLIVVDTTCADTSKMLRNSVESFDCSVVSANKKPFADSDLKTFKALTLHRSTRFESTVGAGLPVICTSYSSAKRENFNYLSRFITPFVVRSTRTTTHSQCNNSNTHTKLALRARIQVRNDAKSAWLHWRR